MMLPERTGLRPSSRSAVPWCQVGQPYTYVPGPPQATLGPQLASWAMGLKHVVDASVSPSSVAANTAGSVVGIALYTVQQTWLVSLSAHRLHSLQRSAGHQFFPNLMTRWYYAGAGYVVLAIVLFTVDGLKSLWMPTTATFAQHMPTACLRHFAIGVELVLIGRDVVLVFLICLFVSLVGLVGVMCIVAVAFCLRVLLAYCRILGHLSAARRVAERSNCGQKVSGLQALQRGERALRKEIFGFALCFLIALSFEPLGYMLPPMEPQAVLAIQCARLLGYTMGAWFLSNSYQLSKRAGPPSNASALCDAQVSSTTASGNGSSLAGKGGRIVDAWHHSQGVAGVLQAAGQSHHAALQCR